MRDLTRITFDPQVMGGKPCIRGVRVTVGTIVGLVAAGHCHDVSIKRQQHGIIRRFEPRT